MSLIILDPPRFGPSCRFGDADVFCTLNLLSGGKRIGRGRIGKYLGIGEGSARKLVEIMREYDLLKVEQPGVTVTKFGEAVLGEMHMRMVDITMQKHVIGNIQQGILIRGFADRIFNGVDQRNIGIRAGGEGCTTWVMKNGALIMAPDWNMDEKEPQQAQYLRSKIDMNDGDVLIIGGGNTLRLARTAAVNAGLEMIN